MSTRILMVGAGGVARRHVDVLTGLDFGDSVRVVGVVDPRTTAAASLATGCGARAFSDITQALDAVAADAVYICVPPFAHGAPERAVLERGLPMFVEKPVGLDVAAAEDIERRAREAGVVTGTGYHWRCLDVLPRARVLLEHRPALAAAGYWLDKRPPVPWWPHADRSGGQVVEQLTHVMDLARLLLGEAEEVYAAGVHADREGHAGGDVDDATVSTVRFVSGAVATFAATSLLAAKRQAALHTFSPGFVAELDETGLVVDRGNVREEYPVREDPRVVVDREFIETVIGRREQTRTPYAEAVESLRLACAVAQSAREARPIRIRADSSVISR
jgi:predicted dehydrogenase